MPAPDFLYDPVSPHAPSKRVFNITPSNTVDLPNPVREIRVGVAGDLACHNEYGEEVNFVAVAVGEKITGIFKRVLVTGTTADSIVGWP